MPEPTAGLALMDADAVRANARTAVEIIDPAAGDGAPLRLAYLSALRAAQGSALEIQEDDAPVVQPDLAAPVSVALLVSIGSRDAEALNADDDERARLRSRVGAGLAVLGEHDPGRAAIARLLIATLVLLRRPGLFSASAGAALGAVALNPAPEWEPPDFAEMLLHESVHQALFLDEMVNTLYAVEPPALAAEEALVTSAVRGIPRPYDAALHAACVAVEVLALHTARDDAERGARWGEGLAGSVAQLVDRRRLLSGHGNEVLDDLVRAVDAAGAA